MSSILIASYECFDFTKLLRTRTPFDINSGFILATSATIGLVSSIRVSVFAQHRLLAISATVLRWFHHRIAFDEKFASRTHALTLKLYFYGQHAVPIRGRFEALLGSAFPQHFAHNYVTEKWLLLLPLFASHCAPRPVLIPSSPAGGRLFTGCFCTHTHT